MDPKRLPRRPNVLAVDDKRSNFLALEAVLGDECQVLFASSGEAALAVLKQHGAIDLILMDIQMPGMDGFETAAAIKKVPQWKDIPIIFVTAVYSEDPFVKKGYQVGGIDYFSKPFDPDILKMKVRIYSAFRLRDELLREREHHVRESEELLRVGRKLSSVLDSLPIGVLIADVEGRVCHTTEEVSRILKSAGPGPGDAYGEILGWWSSDGQALKDENGPLHRALRKGEKSHSERIWAKCLDGSSKSILASAAPLHGLDGQLVGAVVLLQDRSEADLIEEDMEERITRLIATSIELEESASG